MAWKNTKKETATESPRLGFSHAERPGPKPDLKWLPLTDLYIDKLYQRSMNGDRSRGNIVRMQNEFCWAHCGALIEALVPATNKYAVIDGQHRLEAAKRRGHQGYAVLGHHRPGPNDRPTASW